MLVQKRVENLPYIKRLTHTYKKYTTNRIQNRGIRITIQRIQYTNTKNTGIIKKYRNIIQRIRIGFD